jgi:5-methylcytosine-specific restriction endonuclease McrA
LTKLRLTIELVPSSSWLNNVRAIVSRKQWDILRSQVYDQAWNVCQICGGVGPKHPVECHEIWHYDDKKLIQKLEGMIALCPDCHMVKHIGLARIQNRGEKAVKHFMKVNKLSKKEAEKHIQNAFMTWNARSRKKWKLDISSLSAYGIDTKDLVK